MTESVEEGIPYTHRFVATADTRRRFTRAAISNVHRTRRFWVVSVLVLALFTLVLFASFDRSYSFGSRAFWAPVLALPVTLVTMAAIVAMTYVQTYRASRVRLAEGTVIETGFGDDAFVYRTPLDSARVSYRAIRSIARHRDFVFVHRDGLPAPSGWPQELFPDEAVARIRRSVSGGQLQAP